MESCPKLLDLIPKSVKMEQEVSEEKKLELRLGPPGGGDYNNNTTTTNNNNNGLKRGFSDCVNGDKQAQNRVFAAPWKTPCPSSQCLSKESSEKHSTAVPTQKRTTPAPAPVVGWPPVRSFRKNLASASYNSLKASSESQTLNPTPKKTFGENNVAEKSCTKGMFVKINMDGVPIGRKVDLKTYDSYEKLSAAVDELFRGLLAAQGETSASVNQCKGEERVISGLLDGSGEYTLVYEDNEGDRMLAGDVPWHMFVSTVKRLRVLKTSEISKLCGVNKQGKLSLALK